MADVLSSIENDLEELDEKIAKMLVFTVQIVDLDMGMVRREQRDDKEFSPIIRTLGFKPSAIPGEAEISQDELDQFKLQEPYSLKSLLGTG